MKQIYFLFVAVLTIGAYSQPKMNPIPDPETLKSNYTGGGYVVDISGNEVWFFGDGNLNMTGDYNTGWHLSVPS
ncbi:hypothetical protein, partial [Staphylococcus aureus]